MKKTVLNLGKVLNSKEQKQINGGYNFILTNIRCSNIFDCWEAGADRCYFGPYDSPGNGRCAIF